MLEDDPPVPLDVDGPGDLGVVDVGRAEVALRPDPVGSIVGAGPLGGSGVVLVVEGLLLLLGDVLDEIIGGLVRHVGVLLQEEWVLGYLVCDVVGGVLGVQDAVRQVRTLGALRCSLGVAVAVLGGVGAGMVGGGVVRGGVVGRGTVGDSRPNCDGDYKDNRSNLKQNKDKLW